MLDKWDLRALESYLSYLSYAACFKHLNLCPTSPQVNLFQGSLSQNYHDPHVCHLSWLTASSQLPERKVRQGGENRKPLPACRPGREEAPQQIDGGEVKDSWWHDGKRASWGETRHPTGKHAALQVLALLMGEIRCWDVCAPGSSNPPRSQPCVLHKIKLPDLLLLAHCDTPVIAVHLPRDGCSRACFSKLEMLAVRAAVPNKAQMPSWYRDDRLEGSD